MGEGPDLCHIWLTNLMAMIDPTSGDIVGLVDMTDLRMLAATTQAVDVVNGIAYDATGDRLFVTGKLWPTLYQVTLSKRTDGKDLCSALP